MTPIPIGDVNSVLDRFLSVIASLGTTISDPFLIRKVVPFDASRVKVTYVKLRSVLGGFIHRLSFRLLL